VAEHVVTLITRVGCHLCEVAGADLRRLQRELGFAYREVDVDGSPVLRERFSDKVPVILLDGREHSHFRVEERKLRKALAR
jgi:glutaredoxin